LERTEQTKRSSVRSRSSAFLARLIHEECQQLGHAPQCRPCAGVVLQRYNWARQKALLWTNGPPTALDDGSRLRWTRYMEVVDELMREDTPLEDMTREQVTARVMDLWVATKAKRLGSGFDRVRRTFSTPTAWGDVDGLRASPRSKPRRLLAGGSRRCGA
jgi:hypothetical protein